MYTICPSCLRHLRLRAEQLAAARGKVRCGYCREVFNALEHLRDAEGTPPPAARAAGKARPEAAAEYSSVPPSGGLGPEWESEPYLLDVLVGTEPTPRAHPLWNVAVVSLLLLLGVQFSWNYRNELQSFAPALQSAFQWLCAEHRCPPRRWGSLAGLSILDRDIRFHPDYERAVLVNATVINDSPRAMAYPNLQLQLFDAATALVAAREFTPAEYLRGERRVSAGLRAGDQFHVLLELTGAVSSAASFEFGFSYPPAALSVLH